MISEGLSAPRRNLLPIPFLIHSLRRRRGLIVALAGLLAVVQLFMILTARAFEQSGAFRQISAIMPPFLAQWTNMTAASFTGFALFGYSHPIVLLFLIAVAVSISPMKSTASQPMRFLNISPRDRSR